MSAHHVLLFIGAVVAGILLVILALTGYIIPGLTPRLRRSGEMHDRELARKIPNRIFLVILFFGFLAFIGLKLT